MQGKGACHLNVLIVSFDILSILSRITLVFLLTEFQTYLLDY